MRESNHFFMQPEVDEIWSLNSSTDMQVDQGLVKLLTHIHKGTVVFKCSFDLLDVDIIASQPLRKVEDDWFFIRTNYEPCFQFLGEIDGCVYRSGRSIVFV